MDEALIRKIVREELEVLLEEKEEKEKITGYEFRVCYQDGGGQIVDRITSKEEDALFHKRYLEAQGKHATVYVYSYLQEHSWEYNEFKKQRQKQRNRGENV